MMLSGSSACSFHNRQTAFQIGYHYFVGLPVRFEVHGMPAILHPFQNCGNGAAVPAVRIVRQSAADFSFLPVLINGGRQHMILFQHPGNLRRTVPVHAEGKDALDHLCRFRIDS